MVTTALAVPEKPAAETGIMKVDEVLEQMGFVQDLMRRAMNDGKTDGEDYGTIPGCGDKRILKKPGAEKLLILFRLAPKYTIECKDLAHGHREYRVRCDLTHIPTGRFVGNAETVCTTMETKYRWRKAEKVCPHCKKAAIIKGKEEYGGGWICFQKKDGCGAKFKDGDAAIESQKSGRVENDDIADVYNTVIQIAEKRAMVAAVRTSTAASGLFTQDMEERLDGDAAMDAINDAPQTPATKVNAAPKNGTAKKAPAAATPASTSQVFEDRITGVEAKHFKRGTAEKPMPDGTRWIINTAGGTPLTTFSDTIAKRAEQAMAEEFVVTLEWEDKGRGAVLLAIHEAAVEGELVG